MPEAADTSTPLRTSRTRAARSSPKMPEGCRAAISTMADCNAHFAPQGLLSPVSWLATAAASLVVTRSGSCRKGLTRNAALLDMKLREVEVSDEASND